MKRKMVITIGILAVVTALPAAALASVKSDGAGGSRHQAGIQASLADCDGTGNAFGYGPGDGSGLAPAPEDGTGYGPGDGTGMAAGQANAYQVRAGNSYGPGDGTGNAGLGPKDGSGYGTGDCDGDQLRMGARIRTGAAS